MPQFPPWGAQRPVGVNNGPPKSLVSSSQNEVVPHINIRSPRLQPGKFVIGGTKRLLQHYPPEAALGGLEIHLPLYISRWRLDQRALRRAEMADRGYGVLVNPRSNFAIKPARASACSFVVSSPTRTATTRPPSFPTPSS